MRGFGGGSAPQRYAPGSRAPGRRTAGSVDGTEPRTRPARDRCRRWGAQSFIVETGWRRTIGRPVTPEPPARPHRARRGAPSQTSTPQLAANSTYHHGRALTSRGSCREIARIEFEPALKTRDSRFPQSRRIVSAAAGIRSMGIVSVAVLFRSLGNIRTLACEDRREVPGGPSTKSATRRRPGDELWHQLERKPRVSAIRRRTSSRSRKRIALAWYFRNGGCAGFRNELFSLVRHGCERLLVSKDDCPGARPSSSRVSRAPVMSRS
jgi:hypothetical protein